MTTPLLPLDHASTLVEGIKGNILEQTYIAVERRIQRGDFGNVCVAFPFKLGQEVWVPSMGYKTCQKCGGAKKLAVTYTTGEASTVPCGCYIGQEPDVRTPIPLRITGIETFTYTDRAFNRIRVGDPKRGTDSNYESQNTFATREECQAFIDRGGK